MGSKGDATIKPEDIDIKISSISNLMRYSEWNTYVEIVLYLQGLESAKLFKKTFLKLDPVEKDKRHLAIVSVIEALDKLLGLPQWLEKRKPERWNQVLEHLNKEETTNGR